MNKMSEEKEIGKIAQGGANNLITESQRLARLKDVRAPIISEVMGENPGLTEAQLIQMMDEMGF